MRNTFNSFDYSGVRLYRKPCVEYGKLMTTITINHRSMYRLADLTQDALNGNIYVELANDVTLWEDFGRVCRKVCNGIPLTASFDSVCRMISRRCNGVQGLLRRLKDSENSMVQVSDLDVVVLRHLGKTDLARYYARYSEIIDKQNRRVYGL